MYLALLSELHGQILTTLVIFYIGYGMVLVHVLPGSSFQDQIVPRDLSYLKKKSNNHLRT